MRMTLALWLALMLALTCGCEGTTDDDDDAADDDTADDDTADDDDTTQDGPFNCGALTETELALLTKVFCAGSSNSYDNWMSSPPYNSDDLSEWYHGKVIDAVMVNLGTCVEYEPEMYTYWYTSVGSIDSDVTLIWAIDAYFHFLDDDPTEEVFRQRVVEYLDTVYGPNGVSEDVAFIGANVPELLQGITGFTGDTAAILQIIEEEMAVRPNTVMIDLDYFFDQMIMGNIVYDGDEVGQLEIFIDALHVNEFGHQLLAELVIQEINGLYPVLKVEPLGELVIDD